MTDFPKSSVAAAVKIFVTGRPPPTLKLLAEIRPAKLLLAAENVFPALRRGILADSRASESVPVVMLLAPRLLINSPLAIGGTLNCTNWVKMFSSLRRATLAESLASLSVPLETLFAFRLNRFEPLPSSVPSTSSVLAAATTRDAPVKVWLVLLLR